MKKKVISASDLANNIRSQYFPFQYKNFIIKPVDSNLFYKELNKHFNKVFPSINGYKPSKNEIKDLAPCYLEYKKIHSEKFLIYFNNKVVGWFMGEMEDFETFYMRNTGILPQYQNKGIYTAFLKQITKYIYKIGYAKITSHHTSINARILSLKLKHGFVIVGQEIHERWGNLIKIAQFKNKKRHEFFCKRVS